VKISKILQKYWNYIFSLLATLLLVPLLSQSLERVLFVVTVLVIWNILGLLFKDFVKASLLALLLILPFNITYQLPYSLLGMQLSDPYVNGVIVNYLIPTISILDLGVFLLLLSLVFNKKINIKWEGLSFLKIFLLLTGYLLLQSIFKASFLSFFNSIRLLLYLFTFYNLLKELRSFFKQKDYTYILVLSISLVIFQGLISFNQYSEGASIGLFFLGESSVVSGMMGSSFINLNNRLLLRGYGTFPHPNVFSGWLIFNILLGWFLFESMNRKRDFSIFLMLISSLALFLTFSRVSFIICGVIWLAFVIKMFINSRRIKNFAFWGLLSERALNLFTGGDTSWGDRVELMKASYNVIKENLLTGVGLGRFVQSMGDSVPRSSNGILLLQPVHNIFLLMLSEVGLLGCGLFSTLLYFFFKEKKWTLRFIVGLLVIFIIGMFDHYLFSLPQGLVLVFLIVII
jgi:O-antigen ligase